MSFRRFTLPSKGPVLHGSVNPANVELACPDLSTGGQTEHLHLLHGIHAMFREVIVHQVSNTLCTQRSHNHRGGGRTRNKGKITKTNEATIPAKMHTQGRNQRAPKVLICACFGYSGS